MNPRRAAFALRLAAWTWVGSTAVSVGVSLASSWLLGSGSGGADLTSRLTVIHLVSRVASFTAILLVGTALSLLLSATGKGVSRTLLVAALAAVAVHLGVRVFDLVAPAEWTPEGGTPLLRRVLWLADGIALDGALGLGLVAAWRAETEPAKRPPVAIPVYALLAALTFLYDVAVSIDEPKGEGASFVYRGLQLLATATSVAFVVASLRGAGRLARGVAAGAPDAAPAPGADGSPLRLFGWALVLRVCLGVVLALGQAIALATRSYGAAQGVLVLGVVAGLGLAAMLAVALTRQLALPAPLRSEGALVVALVAVGLGVLLDIGAAASGSQLFGLVGEAQRATSFWGGPSYSRMEGLQTAMTWLGRAALVVGVGGALAAVQSLRATAFGLKDWPLHGLSYRVTVLLVVGGLGGLGLGALLGLASRSTLPAIGLGGLVLLVVGIWMLVDLLRLVFGLARAVERGPATAPSAPP